MRIVVSGGAGYVGSVLVPQLLRRGHEVVVFDACLYGTAGLQSIAELVAQQANLSVVRGSLEAPPSDLLRGADAVIHLAGFSNDPTAEFSPERTLAVNVEGTTQLLRMAEEAKVERFILASSASLYDREEASTDVLDETAEIDPQSTYSHSKAICETLLFKSVIPVPVALRKGTLFGWSPRMRWDLVVNTMVRDAVLSGEISIVAGGEMWRPLLHVADAAKAYVWAVESHQQLVAGHIFNVVKTNVQVRDVARIITETLVGVKVYNVEAAGKIRDYRISGEKLTRAGFTPTLTIPFGVQEVLGEAAKRDAKELADPHGENIRWLRVLREVADLLAAGIRP
jgi:nucleoside-diphosphate-sugar epimerase